MTAIWDVGMIRQMATTAFVKHVARRRMELNNAVGTEACNAAVEPVFLLKQTRESEVEACFCFCFNVNTGLMGGLNARPTRPGQGWARSPGPFRRRRLAQSPP
jgi:hypothetical protein